MDIPTGDSIENARRHTKKSSEVILWLDFNQDLSCLAVGTTCGFRIFNCDPLTLCYDYIDDANESGARIVSMLFCTSMIGIVGLGDGRLRVSASHSSDSDISTITSIPKNILSSSRTLSLLNTKHGSVLYDLRFPSTIFHVQMNRKRILINCDGQIFIYDMSTMTKLFYLTVPSSTYSFTATPSKNSPVDEKAVSSSASGSSLPLLKSANSSASILPITIQVTAGRHLASLSPNSEEPFFAIPDINSPGDLLIYDASSEIPSSANVELGPPNPAIRITQAHKSSIAYVKFNSSGNLVATASDKGTIIRIFSLPDGICRYQFRRGSFTMSIAYLSFSENSNFLVAASEESDTIHIFKLLPFSGILSSGLMGSLLPSTLNDALEPERHFAFAKVPEKIRRLVCAVISNSLIVATYSGSFYTFKINLDLGGECILVNQQQYVLSSFIIGHRLL